MALKLFKDLVDEATVATLPENGNFKAPGNSIITKRDPFAYAVDRLLIADGAAFDVYDGAVWRQISNRGTIDLNAAAVLDTGGAFNVGTDYFVYLCLDENGDPQIVISANATYPLGFSPERSRKIGGFHYGHVRHVSDDGKWVPTDSSGGKYGGTGIIWQNNVSVGIVPNSVWDLKNRPHCAPEGMVKIGNFWVDIYPSSAAETIVLEGAGLSVVSGKLQSRFGHIPVTGTEGLNWYGFAELASLAGKKMLTYADFIAAARGNPQGEAAADNYGWTKTTNTARYRTGCNVDASGSYIQAGGVKPFAVSAMNCVDTVGNVWEWLAEQTYRQDGGAAGWTWRDVLGAGKGQAHLYNDVGLVSLIAGGSWYNAVGAGSRAVLAGGSPWDVSTGIGVRLACDAA
jgi:formylglycine-generating enzyme required for sulfatase activity